MKLRKIYQTNYLPQYRSTISLVEEVSQLIEKLEAGMDNFTTTLVNQFAYFYIINPSNFSPGLRDDWLAIRSQVGLQDISHMNSVESMRARIHERIKTFTEEDIGSLMIDLYYFRSKLLAELRKG